MSLPIGLLEIKQEIEGYARSYGLDFFETIFEMVDYNTMNEIAAFGGFPTRYNHWRFGMEYEQLSKSYEYGLSKIYEMVINNDPAYAYLLEGNNMTDQKTVIAHVYAHVDFFKNNFYFSKTNRKMVDAMANHATRVRRYIDRYGLDVVEDFIETCLSIDNLIDYHAPYKPPRQSSRSDEDEIELNEMGIPKLPSKDYMDTYINPQEFIEEQRQKMEEERAKRRRHPEYPEKDVMHFLLQNSPLERWEADILSMIREEAYYFAPQGQTKIMNEGWACLRGDSLVFTDAGLITMAELVAGDATLVCDGHTPQRVYDQHIIRQHDTVEITTRLGFTLCGSNNHRLLTSDGKTWRRLDELQPGDTLTVSGGQGLWPAHEVPISWTPPTRRRTLNTTTTHPGASARAHWHHPRAQALHHAEAVASTLDLYEQADNLDAPTSISENLPITLPATVTPAFGAFLGYLIGDSHHIKRHLEFTTDDDAQAAHFAVLALDLFGLHAVIKPDHAHLHVLIHSQHLADLLDDELGLPSTTSAPHTSIPKAILRSPANVVRAFLRTLFDREGLANEHGVTLRMASDTLAAQTQLLLLNDGILSRRRQVQDGCWQLRFTGVSAQRFADVIGFGLTRKQHALDAYLDTLTRFEPEAWTDEVISITHGRNDVYDISVEETHRYAAQGLVNHNSYWHSKILTHHALKPSEIIDYAEAVSGVLAVQPGQLNPYKLGIELLRDVEDRWNKGKFGKEWEECTDMHTRENWDRNLGLGREKIFQVRALYNDINFIDEFLTEDFCRRNNLFTFAFNNKNSRYEIASREFQKVKQQLLFSLTNFGQPYIYVKDSNFKNRSELLLHHKFESQELRMDYARDVLRNVFRIWKRTVNIETIIDNKGRLLSFDGSEHREQAIKYEPI